MTNCTKMVEKNTDKHSYVSSHSRPNNHKGLHRSNVGKGARGPSQLRTGTSCVVSSVKGKHQKVDDNTSDRESMPKKSNGTVVMESNVSANASRQGIPNSRHSPSKEKSPRSSPSLASLYAGAKFSEPPSPTTLPKPPTHWTAGIFMATGHSFPLKATNMADMYRGDHLKMFVKVSA